MTASTLLTNLPVERPFRWATDCLSFVCRERIGKTATLRKSLRNVAVERSIAPKFVADALLWIEDNDGMSSRIPYYAECRSEIGVPGDEYKRVRPVLISVLQQLCCHVDVCQFFGCPYAANISWMSNETAGFAWALYGLKSLNSNSIVAFKHLYSLGRKSIKISGLSFGSVAAVCLVYHARCEILDRVNSILGQKKLLCKGFDIEPFIWSPAKHPIVQVASVDIDYRSLQFHIKMLGLRRTEAPRRLPESRRVKNPVIGGIGNYTTFLVAA